MARPPFPKIVFVGPGRCGKDTACKWFGKHTRLVDSGPTSAIAVVAGIAEDLGVSPEQAYAERGQNRPYWRGWLDAYRAKDPARLVRDCLSRGDVCNGVRSKREIRKSKEESLADYVVWIHNPTVPPDTTLDFGPEEADLVLENTGTLEEFETVLTKFAESLGLEVFPGRAIDD